MEGLDLESPRRMETMDLHWTPRRVLFGNKLMINVGAKPPSWFALLLRFLRTPRAMRCQVTYTKTGTILKRNFFIIHLLGPQIVIPCQVYLCRESFAKIHFYIDPSIGADVIVL
jgi:hypothetical protein